MQKFKIYSFYAKKNLCKNYYAKEIEESAELKQLIEMNNSH